MKYLYVMHACKPDVLYQVQVNSLKINRVGSTLLRLDILSGENEAKLCVELSISSRGIMGAFLQS